MKVGLKRKIWGFIKSENAAAEMVEAAIIYPIVFLFLFLMIYIGLFIMQTMTVGAYAEKIAMLAAREVAHPGYVDMFSSGGEKAFGSGSAEADAIYGVPIIELETNANNIDPRPYRYWYAPLSDDDKAVYKNILLKMVKNNSILCAGNVTAKVDCKNYIVTQYIEVEVKQELTSFAVLDFFGIDNPSVKASARATVSDTDEFVRNINFASDAIEAIAEKCGVDISKLKNKIKDIREKFDL